MQFQDHLILEPEIHLCCGWVEFLDLTPKLHVTRPLPAKIIDAEMDDCRFALRYHGDFHTVCNANLGEFTLPLELFENPAVKSHSLNVSFKVIGPQTIEHRKVDSAFGIEIEQGCLDRKSVV